MSSVVVPFPANRAEREVEPSCAGHDPSWWFEPAMFARAVKICERCEMRAACLAEALQSGERLGVWGGLTPEQRAELPDAQVIRLPHRRGSRR
jgi:Transcription factor WhiB